jgi:hypothetical protein
VPGAPPAWLLDKTRAASRTREAHMSAGEPPIKQAIQWIDNELHDHPNADRLKLIDEASRRFDLSPADAEFLFRHLASKAK